MKEREWEEYKKRSRKWAIRMSYELLHSEAYRNLKYGPAVKCLNWFYEKVRFRVDRRKKGDKRYQPVDNGEISFTYEEALRRGVTNQQFSKSLKELHARGFIDIRKAGSGLMGDYTIYAISQRWKDFGMPQFEHAAFPKSNYVGYRRGGKTKQAVKTHR